MEFFRILFDEYKAMFTDVGVLLILLGGLLIYTLFYPVPYSPEVLKEQPVVAVDQDNTALSRKLLRMADAAQEVKFTHFSRDLEDAREYVLADKASGVFIIPKGFEGDILRGEKANVAIYTDATYFLKHSKILSGLYTAAATLSAGIEIKRFTAKGKTEPQAYLSREPLPLVSRPLFNPTGGYASYVVPAVFMIILQQTLLIAIGLVAGTRRETKQEATYRRHGDSHALILIARSCAFFSVYIFYPLFYIFVIFRFFDLESRGDLPTLMLFLVPYVLAITLLGQTLGLLFRLREHALSAIIFSSMPAVFLAGFAWPAEALPPIVRNLSLLLPSSSGVPGFLRINQMQANLFEVRFEWCTLWAICLFYFLLAWLLMHGQERFTESGGEETDTPREDALSSLAPPSA